MNKTQHLLAACYSWSTSFQNGNFVYINQNVKNKENMGFDSVKNSFQGN